MYRSRTSGDITEVYDPEDQPGVIHAGGLLHFFNGRSTMFLLSAEILRRA
jgi:hypothetical protein